MAVRRIELPDEIRAAASRALTRQPLNATGSHATPEAPEPNAPETPVTFTEPDYAAVFELRLPQPTTRSPEDWARAVFEGAPAALRWFMRVGWRFPLGFQLGPPGTPGHVLGCRIIGADRTTIVLEQRSPLMTAHNIVLVERTRIIWATLVSYQSPMVRPLWSVAAVLHHRILPHLLTRATRH